MSKIVFLLSQSLDSPSGLGRYGPLARELVKLGHEVDILALHPGFDDLEQTSISFDGVRVHYVAPMHVQKEGDYKIYYSSTNLILVTLRATWHLSRAAIHKKADIVHIGKPHPMNSIAGLLAKYINRSDLYLDCDDFEAGSGRFNSQWQKTIISLFEKWIPHLVSSITTNTFFMRDKLIAWGIPAKSIIYLPNGVDTVRFSPPDPEKVEQLRKELKLGGKKVIAYVGSLSIPSHPVDLLMEAFQKLHEIEKDTILMLVGGGEDINTLKNLSTYLGITHATRFCGKVPPDKVSLYYSLADVSVDPVYDNDAAKGRSPLKLFESWFCGVPYVTADVGDRRLLLDNSRSGLLSRPGDPHSLADAIFEVLSNPYLANSIREEGKNKVKIFFWDKLVTNLEELYLNQNLSYPSD